MPKPIRKSTAKHRDEARLALFNERAKGFDRGWRKVMLAHKMRFLKFFRHPVGHLADAMDDLTFNAKTLHALSRLDPDSEKVVNALNVNITPKRPMTEKEAKKFLLEEVLFDRKSTSKALAEHDLHEVILPSVLLHYFESLGRFNGALHAYLSVARPAQMDNLLLAFERSAEFQETVPEHYSNIHKMLKKRVFTRISSD